MGKKTTGYFIIGTFVTLYLLVSVISTIHVIEFFELSNPRWLAVSLAIAFEVGAAASLASLITLEKMNKGIVWSLFIILTAMQAMGNTYYAFTHLQNFQGWIELFGLVDEELIYQKRVLSIVSGAILPVVALGFIKSLVDYIKPVDDVKVAINSQITDAVTQVIKPEIDVITDDLNIEQESINESLADEPAVEEPKLAPELKDQESLDIVLDVTQPVETTTTTVRTRIDKSKSIDELIARGLPLAGASGLKKPFDP
jgi:hypothetical protein